LGIARALAAEGAAVVLNGFGNPDEIEKLRQDLAAESKVAVLYNGADLSRADACEALVRDTEIRLGSVDILVNNAGIQHLAPIESFPVERWDAVIAINLRSAFHTIRAALPGMKNRDFGRIINIASAHGLVASVNRAAYVSAKHGLVGLTKMVALETAESPITCNAICPGVVLTQLVRMQIDARGQHQGYTGGPSRTRTAYRKGAIGAVHHRRTAGGLGRFLKWRRGRQSYRRCPAGGWRVDGAMTQNHRHRAAARSGRGHLPAKLAVRPTSPSCRCLTLLPRLPEVRGGFLVSDPLRPLCDFRHVQ